MSAYEILNNQRRERNMEDLYKKFPYLKDCDIDDVVEYLWLHLCKLEVIIDYAKSNLDTGRI